jgi:RAS guanyl-releasing protein 3
MSEWKTYARKTKLSSVPSLEKYVVRFNGLSRWIEAMVLNGDSPERRAHVIEKFLNVAQVYRICIGYDKYRNMKERK